MTSSTFEQVLDHFSKEDGVTFGQRYFTSDRYVSEGGTGEDAVNFLCVGGEGEFSLSWSREFCSPPDGPASHFSLFTPPSRILSKSDLS